MAWLIDIYQIKVNGFRFTVQVPDYILAFPQVWCLALLGHSLKSLEDVEHGYFRRLFNGFNAISRVYGDIRVTEVKKKTR